MIPVLLAVGTSAVLVRLLGVTLSPLTTVSGPLVVATCAEFCILLVARYAEERDRGRDPTTSTRVAAERTGRAFFTSALTTLGGFAVLMFSPLPLLADFGLVVTINIAVAVLAALVVVPPLAQGGRPARLAGDGPGRRATPTSRGATASAGSPRSPPPVSASSWRPPTSDGDSAAAPPRRTEAAEAPAVLPTTTTAPPTTAPASTVPGSTGDRPARCRRARPSGRAGLIAGLFWDALTGAGVDPGVARCAADDLIATTPEAGPAGDGHRQHTPAARGRRPAGHRRGPLWHHARATGRGGGIVIGGRQRRFFGDFLPLGGSEERQNRSSRRIWRSNMSARKHVVETYFDGFRLGDHARVLACLTDDVAWDLPGYKHLTGKEAFDGEILSADFQGRPTLTVDRMVEEGDIVVAIGSGEATRTTGDVHRFVYCDVFTFRGELIARVESYLVALTGD